MWALLILYWFIVFESKLICCIMTIYRWFVECLKEIIQIKCYCSFHSIFVQLHRLYSMLKKSKNIQIVWKTKHLYIYILFSFSVISLGSPVHSREPRTPRDDYKIANSKYLRSGMKPKNTEEVHVEKHHTESSLISWSTQIPWSYEVALLPVEPTCYHWRSSTTNHLF